MKRRVLAVVAAGALLVALPGIARASDDPDYQLQYGPQQIHAPEAWSVARGKGVTIAIVDTGVQLDHPDLKDKLVPGYDFLEDDDQPDDSNGHGTHVAGIAGASTDNGIGIAGVAPDAKLMPIRVLGGEATSPGAILSVQQGIRFAYEHGARVINLSLTEVISLGASDIRTLESSCLDAWNAGSLCVVAAGNDGKGKASGYSSSFQALLVAANDRNGNVADFSQKADSKWGVTAPGVGIESTVPGSDYGIKQGTSMAAPHVSGVAALLFSMGMTNQQVVDKILSTATPINDGGGSTGAGLVNAAAAVGAPYAASTAPVAASTATTAAPTGEHEATSATTVPRSGPTTTATLVAGTVEDSTDFRAGAGSEFTSALGDDARAGPPPISQSGGYDGSFLLAVAAFVGMLGAIGFAARRIVLRRGVGEIH